jgi:hypothetical protein
MKRSKYPPRWDEARIKRVLEHYEGQSDEEAAAEDDAADSAGTVLIEVPAALAPAIRELIASFKRSV